MKVLFAMGSDQLSKNIADNYYKKYGEILEYNSVFFFKSLVEEVKNNKTYDRIIINEDFEEYRTKDLEQVDKIIFNYIDIISDEVSQGAEIIIICSNRRTKSDPFISRLFTLGIYNLLIGNDRSISFLCDVIKNPKNKREAKQYLNIDTTLITENEMTRDNEVDEGEVKSILSYYEGAKNTPEQYVPIFDRVASQYSRVQLKEIFWYLPKEVKTEILKVDRYKYLAPNPSNTNQTQSKVSKNEENTVNQSQGKQKKKGGLFSLLNRHKEDSKQNVGNIDMSQLQAGGTIDLSSNSEEQKIKRVQEEARKMAEEKKAKEQAELTAKARAEAEAKARAEAEEQARIIEENRRQAELEARARAEVAKREQEELASRARAEAAKKEQEELEARARAEAAKKEQEELEARARAEAARKQQIELEARARAEAAKKEQEELEARARAEAAKKQQEELEAKEKAIAAAKAQEELKAKAKAEAEAFEQAKNAAKAKAEEKLNLVNGVPGQLKEKLGINSNELVEIKPNPNAPERNAQKKEIPTAIPNIKVDVNIQNKNVEPPKSPVVERPKPPVVEAPKQPVVEPPKPPVVEAPKPPVVERPKPPVVEAPKQPVVEPKINITTNSGVAPNHAQTQRIVNNIPTNQPKVNEINEGNKVHSNNVGQSEIPAVNKTMLTEQERLMKEEQEKLAIEQKKIREAQEKLEEEKRKLKEAQEKFASAQNQMKNESAQKNVQYVNTDAPMKITSATPSNKMIVIVGANKVGTTFVTNAIAHAMASSKIVTSVIDMTRDKSLYYIYVDESKALKNRANECMQRLADGEDYYIETANSYLKLYTSMAGTLADQRRGFKHKAILETVKENCNLTIVDADFTTPIDYFDQADEIYLVQDLDILKIQDVTLFLRELNARGLDKKKIRLIINKYVKTSITPKIIVGALDFYHDPAGTYVDSGLMPNKVDYSLIPYNLNNYAKYVEALHKMSGEFNYKNYSTDFNDAIKEICGKLYSGNPQPPKTRRFFG